MLGLRFKLEDIAIETKGTRAVLQAVAAKIAASQCVHRAESRTKQRLQELPLLVIGDISLFSSRLARGSRLLSGPVPDALAQVQQRKPGEGQAPSAAITITITEEA